MQAVTIREAKTRLNELVNAAARGEQVILMRRSQHVATIVPISDRDLELVTGISDAQAGRLWQSLSEEAERKSSATFKSVETAVRTLRKVTARKSAARKAASKRPAAERLART